MTPTDEDALALALAVVRDESRAQRQHFEDKFDTGANWVEIAKSAAYHCQIVALHLMPWQSPPCYADPAALSEPLGDARRAREGAELLQRMERCGVSKWHPSPISACEAAEATQ